MLQLHQQFDILGPDRYAYGVRQYMDPFKCSVIFVVFFVSSYLIIMMFGNTRPLQASIHFLSDILKMLSPTIEILMYYFRQRNSIQGKEFITLLNQ